MAYAAWSVIAGEQPTAAKWNILGTNDASFNDGTGIAAGAIGTSALATGIQVVQKMSNPYKFSGYRNAALNSSNTATLVQHDSELYDTGGNFDTVTNKGRFTAPITAFYTFKAMAGNTVAGSTPMFSYLYKNASRVKIGSGGNLTTSGFYSLVAGDLSLSATDYVEHYFIGGGGSVMDVGSAVCFFDGAILSQT